MDPTEAAVSRTELADAVEALGPEGSPQREIWRLMYVEDRPVAEVAELMGVSGGDGEEPRTPDPPADARGAATAEPMPEGGGR